MAQTPNLGLVYLSESQAQKATFVNNGWNVLDAAVVRKSGDTMTGALKIAETPAASSGTPNPDLWTVEVADTGLAAGVEAQSILFDMSATRQFATGALTTQRAMMVKAPTYGFVGASTLTNAATVTIDKAPVAGTNATITNSWALWVQAGGIQVGSQTTPGLVGISRAAVSSGTPASLLQVVTPADTAMTAGAEATAVTFDLSATRQWATGALTTQRGIRVLAPTYGFVGASTITTASTVSISGSPVAGTNATITNSYALNVETGASFFGGTVNILPSVASRSMTINHFSGFAGATVFLNPAAGNKRVLLNLGGAFQWGTDVGAANVADYWLQSLTTGSLVTTIDTGNNVKFGSQSGAAGSVTVGMLTTTKVGFYGVSGIAQAAAYTLAGSATRTFPTDPSGAYTGIASGVGGTPYAQLTDLNTLRTAVSTLIGVVRQLTTDLGTSGGVGLNAT